MIGKPVAHWRLGIVLLALAWLSAMVSSLIARTGGPTVQSPASGGVIVEALWANHIPPAYAQAVRGAQVPAKQSDVDVQRKSTGCLSCHTPDSNSMHSADRPIG